MCTLNKFWRVKQSLINTQIVLNYEKMEGQQPKDTGDLPSASEPQEVDRFGQEPYRGADEFIPGNRPDDNCLVRDPHHLQQLFHDEQLQMEIGANNEDGQNFDQEQNMRKQRSYMDAELHMETVGYLGELPVDQDPVERNLPQDRVQDDILQDIDQNAEESGEDFHSQEDDERFYSMQELSELEPQLYEESRLAMMSENSSSQHALLTPLQYRAKLYFLNAENKWLDHGTGYFRILLSKDNEEHYMQIISEEQTSTTNGQDGSDSPMHEEDNQEDKAHQEPHSETKPQILHRSFIYKLHEFSRQRDTIITWQDERKKEYALSFQDQRGALNTWLSICYLKGIQVSANLEDNANGGENANQQDSEDINQSEIPLPTIDNLQEIVQELVEADPYTRRRIAQAVMKGESSERMIHSPSGSANSYYKEKKEQTSMMTTPYLDRLQKVFNEVETDWASKKDQGSKLNEGYDDVASIVDTDKQMLLQTCISNLHSLFQIYRNLLALNDRDLLEILMNESYWRTTFGALEYDPEVFMPQLKRDDEEGCSPLYPGSGSENASMNYLDAVSLQTAQSAAGLPRPTESCANFREFLEHKVRYREAVEINDPVVLQSIHLSYRLQYLKETAMARFIDDPTSHAILQLIVQTQQQILDYIFGDEYDRIQEELLAKMKNKSDVDQQEVALEFFKEVCQLLKSIQINHRFPFEYTRENTKLMSVLALNFNIMVPDVNTLRAELNGKKEELVKIFLERVDQQQAQDTEMEGQQEELSINPPKESISSYLKNPIPAEDPSMTQIDLFKSNSIEIFNNLLILQNNNMRHYFTNLRSQGFAFLKNLALHMIYSSQSGIKVSICEFLKDLISQETPERKLEFQDLLLSEVVSTFLDFLDQPRVEEAASGPEETKSEKIIQSEESPVFTKALDQSRCLVIQFLCKLVQDSVSPHKIRVFFVQKKVFQRVAALNRFHSAQTNVEIIKFFKAILTTKDKASMKYIVKNDLFDQIIEIMEHNPNKKNLLHSCILSMFDILPENMQPPGTNPELFNKLLRKFIVKGFHKSIFLNTATYGQDFRRFNKYLQEALSKGGETENKSFHDRDQSHSRSRSQSQVRNLAASNHSQQLQDQSEDDLMNAAFGDQVPKQEQEGEDWIEIEDVEEDEQDDSNEYNKDNEEGYEEIAAKERREKEDEEYNQQAYLKMKRQQEQRGKSQENPAFQKTASDPSLFKNADFFTTKQQSSSPGRDPKATVADISGLRPARSMSPVRSFVQSIKIELKPPGGISGVDEVEMFEKRERRSSFEVLAGHTPEKAKSNNLSAKSVGSSDNPDLDESEFNSRSWLRQNSFSSNGSHKASSIQESLMAKIDDIEHVGTKRPSRTESPGAGPYKRPKTEHDGEL